MNKNYYNITIALAGMCQSVKLIQQIAYHGEYDSSAFDTILYSIIQTNPVSVIDIYQHEKNLHVGLRALIHLLQGQKNADQAELTRYTLNVATLAKKLSLTESALQQLAERLNLLKNHQLQHFPLSSERAQHNLATIYSDVVSPIGRRIQIVGRPEHLQQSQLQDKIRALLLGGIRSAILWRQMKGNSLQFIYARKRLLNTAHRLLQCT